MAELAEGRFHGAVEDKLLDELGGLEQGIRRAGGFGEILVEVAQETSVPAFSAVGRQGVSEVVDEDALLVTSAPEIDDRTGTVVAEGDLEEGVVGAVEEERSCLPLSQFGESLLQPTTVGGVVVILDIRFVAGQGQVSAVGPGGGEVGLGDEVVVLAKAYEDSAKHPGNGDLGDALVEPWGPGARGSAELACLVVFSAETGAGFADRLDLLAEVGLGPPDLFDQVAQQGLAIDHEPSLLSCLTFQRTLSIRAYRRVPTVRVGSAG